MFDTHRDVQVMVMNSSGHVWHVEKHFRLVFLSVSQLKTMCIMEFAPGAVL